jgi:hypothetical protein
MDGKKGVDESTTEGAGMSAPKQRLGAEKQGASAQNTGFE